MRLALWMVSIAAPMFAQVQGEKVFTAHCSIPYCHGPGGAAGRAPKLIGHSFTVAQLTNTVTNGIANKGMPAFGGQLSREDLDAVISYVMALHGSSSPAAASVKDAAGDAAGKALFFDAVRMGGCGKCHELQKRGSHVAPEIKSVPADLRAVDASHAVTVSPPEETAFPGIVVEQSAKRVRVYDLSSTLPVLRTFAGGSVKVTAGSNWSHRDAVRSYSDAELKEIAAYLQSAIAR